MRKMIFGMLLLMILSAASVNVLAQVRIGGNSNPVASAILDLNADSIVTNTGKLGLALPRVALTSTSSYLPLVGNHKAGMLVYNTATAGSGATAVTPGTYYNNGSAWVRIGTGDGSGTLTGVTAGTGIAVAGTATAPTVGIKTVKADSSKVLRSNGTDVYWDEDLFHSFVDTPTVKGRTIATGVTFIKVFDTTVTIRSWNGGMTRIVASGLGQSDICVGLGGFHLAPSDGYLDFYRLGHTNASPWYMPIRYRCYRPSV